MGGKLLFSTDSDIYFFSFLGSLLSPPYCHLSRRSYLCLSLFNFFCSSITWRKQILSAGQRYIGSFTITTLCGVGIEGEKHSMGYA
jgi:hypothetical protein